MAIRQRAAALQQTLAKCGAAVKWVEANQMHITLHFLGEVDDRELYAIMKAMKQSTRNEPSFRVSVGGVGAFPTVRRPKTLWGGIREGDEELRRLHAAGEPGLTAVGVYRREDRGYTPHLTLGRVKDEADGQLLAAELLNYADWFGGDFVVEELLLMQSELRREGPEYSIVGRAELGG
jgi:RNA 2',3'-cyclic 3'-phosphodiesterase